MVYGDGVGMPYQPIPGVVRIKDRRTGGCSKRHRQVQVRNSAQNWIIGDRGGQSGENGKRP